MLQPNNNKAMMATSPCRLHRQRHPPTATSSATPPARSPTVLVAVTSLSQLPRRIEHKIDVLVALLAPAVHGMQQWVGRRGMARFTEDRHDNAVSPRLFGPFRAPMMPQQPMYSSQPLQQQSQPLSPSYYDRSAFKASGSAFNVAQFGCITAFNAGPRRDPLSRQLHIEAIAAVGGGGLKTGPAFMGCLSGSGVSVPPKWPYSWETDMDQHAQRQGLQPARGASAVLTSGAAGASHPNCGILGPQPKASPHFPKLSAGATEEEKRNLLLTNERHRRGAQWRYLPTDTLGLRSSPPMQLVYVAGNQPNQARSL